MSSRKTLRGSVEITSRDQGRDGRVVRDAARDAFTSVAYGLGMSGSMFFEQYDTSAVTANVTCKR